MIPRGTGVSPGLLITFLGGIAVLVIGMLVLLFHYRGGGGHAGASHSNQADAPAMPSEALIHRLDRSGHDGSLVDSMPVKRPGSSASTASPLSDGSPLNGGGSRVFHDRRDHENGEAARSEISVVNNYHGPSSGRPNARAESGRPVRGSAGDAVNSGIKSALASLDRLGSEGAFNGKDEKRAFMASAGRGGGRFRLGSALERPQSRYELRAGTLIPATLLTGINSDLPGEIIAQVSRNVYDTVTGRYLLIPQGTRIIGRYDSQVAFGQSRVLIAWSRLIYPNGGAIGLEGQPGVDLMGLAGLRDLVNRHTLRIFGSALMFSLFGALGQLSRPRSGVIGQTPSGREIIYGAVGQQMSQAGARLVERNINIQPTLSVRPGTNFNVLLTRDMVLPGPYRGEPSIRTGGTE